MKISTLSTLTLTLDSAEVELPATIEFTHTPGCGPTPPTYSHGGLPPEPAEVEIIGVKIGPVGSDRTFHAMPDWMIELLAETDWLTSWLADEAKDILAAYAEERAEIRASEAEERAEIRRGI